MKRQTAMIAAILLAGAVSPATDKPAIDKENLAKLQAVKTVFVDGKQ
jgi:hypothetical protein